MTQKTRGELDEYLHLNAPNPHRFLPVFASNLALDNDRLLKVYRECAGLRASGAAMGGWYDRDGFVPGHSLGQYISGLARMGRTTGDAVCRAKVGELVEGFAATLGSSDQVFAGPNAKRVWPCYVLDKHLAGLVDAFQSTGIQRAREVLPRVFRGALPSIPERGRDRVGKTDPPYGETYVLPESLFAACALTHQRAMYERAVAYLLDREFFDPNGRATTVEMRRHFVSDTWRDFPHVQIEAICRFADTRQFITTNLGGLGTTSTITRSIVNSISRSGMTM